MILLIPIPNKLNKDKIKGISKNEPTGIINTFK